MTHRAVLGTIPANNRAVPPSHELKTVIIVDTSIELLERVGACPGRDNETRFDGRPNERAADRHGTERPSSREWAGTTRPAARSPAPARETRVCSSSGASSLCCWRACGVFWVHAYWGRQARRLREERRLHEELNNPWAIRERYAAGTGVRSNRGARRRAASSGAPSSRDHGVSCSTVGSFSFGSSRVETNEKEVQARREARRKRARWVA